MKPTLVKIDETQYWTPDIIEKAGKIWAVYLYDADEGTFCCELTPSYFLEPLYYSPEKFIEGIDEREQVEDAFDEVLRDDRGRYFHCKDIDRIPEKDKYVSANEFDDLEEAREYFLGNRCLE